MVRAETPLRTKTDSKDRNLTQDISTRNEATTKQPSSRDRSTNNPGTNRGTSRRANPASNSTTDRGEACQLLSGMGGDHRSAMGTPDCEGPSLEIQQRAPLLTSTQTTSALIREGEGHRQRSAGLVGKEGSRTYQCNGRIF